MQSRSSLSLAPPAARTLQPAWAAALRVRLRGLALAREKSWLLCWDENNWLYLLGRRGERQAQVRLPGEVAAACCADDGSAYVAAGKNGEVWWLAPDLTIRWQHALAGPAAAVAVDPFGQYLAVSDTRGNLYFLDQHARSVARAQAPRPLHFLAFAPAAPFVLASADYGLIACFDLRGQCSWRDGLVAHVGALAVSGDGERVELACFTEGLQRYTLSGRNLGRQQIGEPCRLAALSFDGQLTLAAGLSSRLVLLDRKARPLATHDLGCPAVALSLAPLGGHAAVALADGRVMGLEIRAAE